SVRFRLEENRLRRGGRGRWLQGGRRRASGCAHPRRGRLSQAGRTRVRIAALAVVMLLAAAFASAQSSVPLTRERALEAIGNGDPDARRSAAAALGDLGTMSDAPVLLKALRDPDEGVRSAAENALWHVWSRSGDSEIDVLFQQGI